MRIFFVLMRVKGRKLVTDELIESKEHWITLQSNWTSYCDVAESFRGEKKQIKQKFGDGQLASLEVLWIEDRIEGDLIDKGLEEQRKYSLYIVELELYQLCPVLIEESVDTSQVLEEGNNSAKLFFSTFLFVTDPIRNVRKKNVAYGFAEYARIPDLEIALMRLAETLFVNVVTATAELQEGSVCFKDRGEDILIAEVGKEIWVSCSAVFANYAFLHSSLFFLTISLQHLLLLLLHLVQFLFLLVVLKTLLTFWFLTRIEEFLEVALHKRRTDFLVELMSECKQWFALVDSAEFIQVLEGFFYCRLNLCLVLCVCFKEVKANTEQRLPIFDGLIAGKQLEVFVFCLALIEDIGHSLEYDLSWLRSDDFRKWRKDNKTLYFLFEMYFLALQPQFFLDEVDDIRQ